ncbi:hypothetical protein DOS83_09970, partial [Staphylococcus felis]
IEIERFSSMMLILAPKYLTNRRNGAGTSIPKEKRIVWLAFPRGIGRAPVSTLILFPQESRQQYDVIYM